MSILVLSAKDPAAVARTLWTVACNFEDCANIFAGGSTTKADLRAITEAAGWHWMLSLHMCPACVATQKPPAVEPPPAAKPPKKARR